ncbi:MAG TPA: Fic family protein [Burkholderiales bacterium]|nr:Fic family protein [Burkholderiales bacterium]
MPRFDPSRPHNTLPQLPPKADIETRSILKACIDARAAVAALQQAGTLIPNQGVLINTIPLLEAQASSEIENIVTTTDALFRYAQIDPERADAATKEALRYRTALRLGVESLKAKPLSTSTAVAVCSTIQGRDMEIRRVPGTTLTNPARKTVIYTPPVGEALLREKLANWERFIHDQTGIDPLIRMAVAHYQFEAIHPFADGNGRTGRVLNQLMLVEQGLLDLPVLYLSRYIIGNKADYYRLLLAVTRDATWEKWILYMLAGVRETAVWTVEKIQAIHKLMGHTAEYVRSHATKIYQRELVELIFVQPYCRIQNLVEAELGNRQTAAVYLKTLANIGVLKEVKAGREKLFVHPKFIALLTSETHKFKSYGAVEQKPVATKGATRRVRGNRS